MTVEEKILDKIAKMQMGIRVADEHLIRVRNHYRDLKKLIALAKKEAIKCL